VFCAAAIFPGTWGGNARSESELVAGLNVDFQIGARSFWGQGRLSSTG
jgi:hypothetical protein